MPRIANQEDFWAHVARSDEPDACWPWLGARANNGTHRPKHLWYGRLKWGGRYEFAHRVAWTLAYGKVPPNLMVLHRCDNPICVRPGHLTVGTAKDNTDDMVRKNRQARGASIRQGKLSKVNVHGIRVGLAVGLGRQVLATFHGVSRPAIAAIDRRQTWRHV